MVEPIPTGQRADDAPLRVDYDDVARAATTLDGIAHRTPIVSSRTVDRLTGRRVLFKCENLQRVGAFKFRGAYYAMARLDEARRRHGVLAFSSGNHAQAMALAGQLLDVAVEVVMPNDAVAVKLEATRGYGAEVTIYDPAVTTREELAAGMAATSGRPLVKAYDDPDIVAGQGTAAAELFEDIGRLDLLLVPCGGGGLLSGSGIAADALSPGCRVVGVEPYAARDATLSFHKRELYRVVNPDTIADGARTPSLGEITFPLVLRYAHDMVTVSEDSIRRATLFAWQRLKLVVEPTGALALAALLDGAIGGDAERIGVLLSGGNVDLRAFVLSSA